MDIRRAFGALAVLWALLVVFAAPASALVRFDFEDGTLQGWNVVSGDAGELPTGPDTARSDQLFGQQGSRFIGLYENPALDSATITLQSPVFTISANLISLLVGGGDHPDSCDVALYRASDGAELFRETGRDTEWMTRRVWDVRKLNGQQVYLRIVDSATGTWGHLNVDDIHEATPKEEQGIQAELAASRRTYSQWLKSVDAPSERIVYKGAALQDIAMPLGGIGSGHLSICGDGVFRQWDLFNRCSESCIVPDSFFAVYVSSAGKTTARLLQKAEVDGMPPVRSIEFVGEFPIAQMRFSDPDLPVSVSMRAFSPFIPMNPRDSGIPTAIFEFTLRNTGQQDAQVSLLSTLQNAVGYDATTPINGVANNCYGGGVNVPFGFSGGRGILLTNPTLKPDSKQPGTMAIAALSRDVELTPQWDDVSALWQQFARTGDVRAVARAGASTAGRTWNSAITAPMNLRPGEQRTVVFVLAWNFPNLRPTWDSWTADALIGRMYTNWFADAGETIRYVSANYPRLSRETEQFRRTFYKTTLPYYVLDRISAQSSTLASNVCMWLKDGTFTAFEGGGCCPMNCTHVWNYEQQLAHLFPELERNMRRVDLEVQQMENGGIRHRTRLPLDAPRQTSPFVDGHMGTILKSYREYRLSADRAWLDKMWPHIRLAMEYGIHEYDPNRDGVILNTQWNTYDAAMYGPNTFIGTLYLAALRAAEEMAKIEGDVAFAGEVRALFESGAKRLDSACWNGDYYWQIDSKPTEAQVGENKWLLDDWPNPDPDPRVNRPYGKGCHSDQLLGQWWATQLNLGYVLPAEHVRTAIDSILKYNWVPDFGRVKQSQRSFAGAGDPGLYNCTWPKGAPPENYTMYSYEVWTGIEYEVAGLMLQEGRVHDAYQLIKAASDRYNGVRRPPITRNPWAEVECSNHYARAMSAWAILLAAQGYDYCGPDRSIAFDPVISPQNHRSFFTAAEGWGLFTQTRGRKSQENSLQLEYGKLELKTLTLGIPNSAVDPRVSVDSCCGPFAARASAGGKVTVEFAQPITLKAGETLKVKMGW